MKKTYFSSNRRTKLSRSRVNIFYCLKANINILVRREKVIEFCEKYDLEQTNKRSEQSGNFFFRIDDKFIKIYNYGQ